MSKGRISLSNPAFFGPKNSIPMSNIGSFELNFQKKALLCNQSAGPLTILTDVRHLKWVDFMEQKPYIKSRW